MLPFKSTCAHISGGCKADQGGVHAGYTDKSGGERPRMGGLQESYSPPRQALGERMKP